MTSKAKEVGTGVLIHDDGIIKKKPNFKSTVFDNEYEWMAAHNPLSRDPYKTMVKMNGIMITVDRQKEQTDLILQQQKDAREMLDKHEREGGTEVELVAPNWVCSDKSMRKIM
ncbi:hypothetical protein VXS05_17085 [Photobacterium toruni]|uniref:hypothetical protein n=1 Tax=Photobacterium toruni TaxID=1935446 RepID=UPI002E1884FE|nr:hypothetical protein [Photobacterium toruni]